MTRWPSVGTPVVAVRREPGTRAFGMTVGGALLAFAAFSLWRGHAIRAGSFAGAGLVLMTLAAVRPRLLAPLAAAWARVGHALGWFNARVLLTVMFAFVLVPAGWVSRLFGADPLDRHRKGSRWTPYPDRFRDPKHVERMF
jgi:saxitoxin biosynthesis operon SxtJ-like protein